MKNIKVHEMIATVFGAGYAPIAPGTAGSLAGLILYIMLHDWPVLLFIVFGTFFAAGVIAAGAVEKEAGEKDPSKVVVDEFACIPVVFMFIPFKAALIVTGFILYRLFDILKVPPMNKLENIHGGWGIMLDDLMAAVYANLCLHLIVLIF